MAFFVDPFSKFFHPLTGKYREQVVACLKILYTTNFSVHTAQAQLLEKNQIVDVFQETITRTPILADETDEDVDTPRSDREQALWVFKQLTDHAWLEERVDEAILVSHFTFSRMGRIFTQAMIEVAGASFRTRHRNTRNTRNALNSFLQHGEVYDLLDAYEYSERIVSDFTDVIDELEESKRQIVSDIDTNELLQKTTDSFFEFMEKRFMPDIAIRLSADSVEKYRDEIQNLIRLIKEKEDSFKAEKEKELRGIASELLDNGEYKKSLLFKILDSINHRILNASEHMLPKLHQSLRSFTQRVEIIISQMSYIHGGHQSRLLEICQPLQTLPQSEQDARLEKAGEMMAPAMLKIPDASDLKLNEKRLKRDVNTALTQDTVLTQEQQKQLFIQNTLDESFTYHGAELREYIMDALVSGHRIKTGNLPVKDAKELIMFANAIEVGSATRESGYRFKIEPTSQRVEHEYFYEMDEFIISVEEYEHDH